MRTNGSQADGVANKLSRGKATDLLNAHSVVGSLVHRVRKLRVVATRRRKSLSGLVASSPNGNKTCRCYPRVRGLQGTTTGDRSRVVLGRETGVALGTGRSETEGLGVIRKEILVSPAWVAELLPLVDGVGRRVVVQHRVTRGGTAVRLAMGAAKYGKREVTESVTSKSCTSFCNSLVH